MIGLQKNRHLEDGKQEAEKVFADLSGHKQAKKITVEMSEVRKLITKASFYFQRCSGENK